MRIFLDCIPCFIRQALDAARLATDNEQIHEQVLREVLVLAKDLDMSQIPPAMGQKIHRLIRDLVGIEDPYRDIKQRFNDASLRLYPKMRQYIIESKDILETAVRLAIAGNIIDFGVNGRVRERELEKTVSDCLAADFSDMPLESFRRAVSDAREILYIADNAGEIIFDRLLIEQLPLEKVTVVVKGSPVINDATMEDAVLAGLPKIVEVIDNGSDAPGTVLESCSESFLARFEKADLVIAKGQGNYETLSDVDKNIFFVLKAKCPVIARDLGCEEGEMILRESKTFRNVMGMVKEAE
jgi:uncharacterized protein with ATP-grasp and redox domains